VRPTHALGPRDEMNLVRGYWEAKETADKLDAEIENNRKSGHPLPGNLTRTPCPRAARRVKMAAVVESRRVCGKFSWRNGDR
jgi:hypothetical protein